MLPVTDVELVEVGPDEWRMFRDVRLRALADAPAAFGSTYDDWADAPEPRWHERLSAVEFNVVARRDDAVLGMASGVPVGADQAELISMWVEPAARGTGVAGLLVRAVVDWAAAHERTTHLMVRVDNARAIAAYERAGFVGLGPNPDQPADVPPENKMVHRPK